MTKKDGTPENQKRRSMRRCLNSLGENTTVRERRSHWHYHTPFPGKKEMPFWNDGHSGRGITVIQSVHFTGESAFFIIEEENTAPVG